ncbi:MAG: beta-L-arabinofuranosidase domain-containing protein, partial [Bacillus sp. (in: firmicutes)]
MSIPSTKSVGTTKVRIKDEFWDKKIQLIVDKVIPYQWKALNDEIPGAPASHAVENLRIAAGKSTGTFHGMPFQDSDVAKWLEAASNSLIQFPNAELERSIDELIDLIGEAQQENGYLNTFFSVEKPDQQWSDFSHGHELYCAGHFIEAAVAYYTATGKRKLLDVMCRFMDYVDTIIGPEEHKRKVYCGHEEIELALFKLYKTTENEKYF